MAENRIKRDTDTRDLQERPKQWQQPELLPEPDKEAGYAYRWVRVSTLSLKSGSLRLHLVKVNKFYQFKEF